MKIENSDIDCLIDISVFLGDLAREPFACKYKKPFDAWHGRLRKVYILLLQASTKGQPGIQHLVEKGVKNDSDVANAIRLLCPNTGQN